jgi:hypothetical protein
MDKQMIFLTDTESVAWCAEHGVKKPVQTDGLDDMSCTRLELPTKASSMFAVSQRLADTIAPWHTALLWVTLADVWRSSVNLHLYYTLRRSYFDFRLISHAPGHLFLNYEHSDLVTFIEVGLLSGWDMHILGDSGYGRVFVSHDSWAQVWRSSATESDAITAEFQRLRE